MFNSKSNDLSTRAMNALSNASSTATIAGAVTGVAAAGVAAWAMLRNRNVKSVQAKKQKRNADGTFKTRA